LTLLTLVVGVPFALRPTMSIRKCVLTLVLAAFAFPSISFAQHEHRATVLLRNGERVAGVLEDVENNTVFVRVSLHDQRKLPVDQVALIDLVGGASGLPETELSVARGGNHLALLRGGESIQGRFVDVRGGETENAAEPHALIFRTTSGEERRVSLDNVSRIYFGNFPASTNAATGAPATASTDPVPAGSVRVPGNSAWVATPLTVRKGDRVVFNATGQVQLSSDANDVAEAAGSLAQRRAANAPLPQNLAGALIARVGNSAPFPIGNVSTPVTMPADGQLYLGVNDDEVGDNRGEFMVKLTRQRR
jgi:hypothetical protein